MHALSLVLDGDGTVLCSPAVMVIVESQESSSVVIVLFTCQFAVYKYMTVCMHVQLIWARAFDNSLAC